MNNLYVNMGKDIHKTMNTEWEEKDMGCDDFDLQFKFQFVELNVVLQLIEGIAISKAFVIDRINSRVLKDCMRICAREMTYYFNQYVVIFRKYPRMLEIE